MNSEPTCFEWREGRCPCCRKKTEIVLGSLLHERPKNFENLNSREGATRLAREGVCPWCGRRTTTPARTLLGRFEPTLMSFARAGWWL